MELKLHTESIGEIEFCFLDSINSWTVPEVFKELRSDFYGVERANLTPDDIVVDVGANVGMFSIYVNKKFGCKIVAFEPLKINYDNFKRNILLNELNPDDFEIHNFAVTDKDGDTVKLGVQEWNTGGTSIYYKNNVNYQFVQTVNLSKYITSKCKFLKMDCEGSEYSIIPSIGDKINTFDFIGIEYHSVENVGEPFFLKKYLDENFKGKIYPEELTEVVGIQSHFF